MTTRFYCQQSQRQRQRQRQRQSQSQSQSNSLVGMRLRERLKKRRPMKCFLFAIICLFCLVFLVPEWHVLAFPMVHTSHTIHSKTSTVMSPMSCSFMTSRHPMVLHSDIPKDHDHDHDQEQDYKQKHKQKHKQKRKHNYGRSVLSDLIMKKSWMPPPPEDQFIMTGDISVLFLYSFTSHYLNNFVVDSVIANSNSIKDAINTLDPMGEIISLQNPVWISPDQPQLLETVLTLNAQNTLLNHWGPLFSSAGSACVVLCTCWLLAGWWHKAFLYQNSLECDTTSALVKTFETWLSMASLLLILIWTTHQILGFMPMLHSLLGTISTIPTMSTMSTLSTMPLPGVDCLLTKADMMLLVDSATVLIAWRFMANSMMKYFRN